MPKNLSVFRGTPIMPSCYPRV